MKTHLVSLLAALLVASPLAAATTGFNVRDYGATGDGRTLDSPAIDKAINAAAAAGGGTVVLPAGTYLSGSIHLKSNIHLLLEPGSVILGAPLEMKAYDPAEPFEGKAYQDGGHTYFRNSLIWGENLTNVSITGQGMINGGGLAHDSRLLDEINGFAGTRYSTNQVRPDDDTLRIGNKSICLKLCRNILIRDITMYHAGHFAILATGCDNLTIDNVTIDTNRDGMDLDCCRNTVISNCRVNSPRDDGICPKSSFALGTNFITENMTIVNCQVSGFLEGTLLDGTQKPSSAKTGRIKLGTESNGGFRNITIANCTFRHCRGLALEEVDGGILENITISNIAMMDVAEYPIYITTGKRNRGPNVTTHSRIRNILISNVVATDVTKSSGIQITGLPEQPIEGIRLENIRMQFRGGGTEKDAARPFPELGINYPEPNKLGVTPAYGLFARHVSGLELANITFTLKTNDLRPALMFDNVKDLEIDNFKAPREKDVPAKKLEKVTGAVIRNSPVLE